MTTSKLREILKRPVISHRCDSLIEASAAFIGFILFFICGVFMLLWGNLSGDLWPIPQNLAPFWLRLPISILLMIIAGYFFNVARSAILKIANDKLDKTREQIEDLSKKYSMSDKIRMVIEFLIFGWIMPDKIKHKEKS